MGIYGFFVNVFNQLKTRYVLQQYLVSITLCALFFYLVYDSLLIAKETNFKLALFICGWFIANTVLFPFSKFLPDLILNYIITSNRFNIPKVIYYIAQFFYSAMCWAYAVLLAPIGLLIYFITRAKRNKARRNNRHHDHY